MSKLSLVGVVLLKCHYFKGIRRTQAPIDSLPTEIVCQILTSAIVETDTLRRGNVHRIHKPQLAAVCRHWRDIIVNTPHLWTFIELSPQWSIRSLLKAHVERSQECPLDIVCQGFRFEEEKTDGYDEALMDIMMPTVHRWRSLAITNDFEMCKVAVARLGRPVFPLLTHLSISRNRTHRPKFFHPECVPALKHLEACMTAVTHEFPPALEELTIGCSDFPEAIPRSLRIPSVQGLKALSFRGQTNLWRIQRDSIHLPLLTRLSFDVTYAEQLLRVLSVPNLTHVDYLQRHDETLFTAFNGIPSKWETVRELRLKIALHRTREDYHGGLTALCLATPKVRSVEIMAQHLDELFKDCRQAQYPIDRWAHLEKFTVIGGVHHLNEAGRYIVPWLQQRRDMGKSALKLSFLVKGDKAQLQTIVLDDIGQYCDGGDLRVEETIAGYWAAS